jgi:hypothetical protein
MLRKFKFTQNLTRITGTWHEHLCTFMSISLWVLLRMRNISDRTMEKIKTLFMFNKSPPPPRKSCRVWANVGKHCRPRQTADDNKIRWVRCACWVTEATDTTRCVRCACWVTEATDTIRCGRCACWVTKATYKIWCVRCAWWVTEVTDTNSEYVLLNCFSTAMMITPTSLSGRFIRALLVLLIIYKV